MRTFSSFRGITPNNVRGRHIDSIFEDQRHRLFGDQTIREGHELSVPGANISELDEDTRNGYLIELAAPGFDKSDFHIDIHEDVLTIKAELGEDRIRPHDSFSRREHNYHTFVRRFSLPDSVDEDNIAATYRNGILDVFVPILKPVEKTRAPRRITVNGAE